MISTELYNGQGLGNQLWVYVVARIIAKRHDTAFSITGKDQFKGQDFIHLDFGIAPPATAAPYYKERIEYYRGTDIDISRTDPVLVSIGPDACFDGNCQSTKYLDGHRDDILQWITVKDEYKNTSLDQHDCIIHLRFGDFTNQSDVFLPASYYNNAMAYIKSIDKDAMFYCVTDEKAKAEKFLPHVPIIGSALEKESDKHKAAHHHGGPLGIDFNLMLNATYLIIPNSSYSWWAAYLNTVKKIVVAPTYWARYTISEGYWSTSDIITDGFTYLDRNGAIKTSQQCWQKKTAYEAAHSDIFCDTPTTIRLTILQRITKKLWKRKR